MSRKSQTPVSQNIPKNSTPQKPHVLLVEKDALSIEASLPVEFLPTVTINGFLLKPFSIGHLSETLHRALPDRRF